MSPFAPRICQHLPPSMSPFARSTAAINSSTASINSNTAAINRGRPALTVSSSSVLPPSRSLPGEPPPPGTSVRTPQYHAVCRLIA
eukprot:1581200-Rhodomonas_salina.2